MYNKLRNDSKQKNLFNRSQEFCGHGGVGFLWKMMTRRPARCRRYQTWLLLPLAVSYVSLLVSRPPFLFFFSYKSPPVRGTLPLLPLSVWLPLTFLLPISALFPLPSVVSCETSAALFCSVLCSTASSCFLKWKAPSFGPPKESFEFFICSRLS